MLAELIFAAAVSSSAGAVVSHDSQYECHLVLIAKDLQNGSAEKSFRSQIGATAEHRFEMGEHTIVLIATAKLRGLRWYKGKQLIASSLTFAEGNSEGAQVFVAYNPDDQEEVATFECKAESFR